MDTNGRSEQFFKCSVCGAEFPRHISVCPGCGKVVDSSGISPPAKAFIVEIEDYDKLIADTLGQRAAGQRKKILHRACRVLWITLNLFTLCIPWAIHLVAALRRDRKMPRLTVEEKRKAFIIQNFVLPSDVKTVLEVLLYVRHKVAVLARQEVNPRTVYWTRMWRDRAEMLYEKIQAQLIGDKDIAETAYRNIVKNSRKIGRRDIWKAFAGGMVIIAELLAVVIYVPMIENTLTESIAEEEISEEEDFEDTEFVWERDTDGSLIIKGVTLRFPYYWKEEDSHPGYCRFASERNNRIAVLAIGYKDRTEDEAGGEDLFGFSEETLEKIKGDFEDCKFFKYEKYQSDYGVDGLLYSYVFTTKIEDKTYRGTGKCFSFYSPENNRYFFIQTIISNNVRRDNYDEEYMKMIASLRAVDDNNRKAAN